MLKYSASNLHKTKYNIIASEFLKRIHKTYSRNSPATIPNFFLELILLYYFSF